jgi:hypothetical protein
MHFSFDAFLAYSNSITQYIKDYYRLNLDTSMEKVMNVEISRIANNAFEESGENRMNQTDTLRLSPNQMDIEFF